MAADYIVKAGTVPGPLTADLSFADGSSVPDITASGTVILFRMRPWNSDPAVVEAAATALSAARVSYQWVDGDLDIADGAYQAEFDVTWLTGRHETFPADPERPYLVISVLPAIGG
jgi:hypothetical protein